MRFAAFFRNVNLGRPGSPSREQLIAAFEAAGGGEVQSFRAHGNVVFAAAGLREAQTLAEAARDRLGRICGLCEPVYARSLKHLARLVASAPFADAPRDDIYEHCVSFLPAGLRSKPAVPLLTPRRDVEVLRFLAGEAFSVIRRIGSSPGPVNAVLERQFGAPTTTRNWSTVLRLVEKYG